MKKILLFALTVTMFFGVSTAQKKELDNTFFCFNNSMKMPNAPESFEEQAALIKKIGFDGMEGHSGENYHQRWAALDAKGLTMPQMYWSMTLNDDGEVTYDEEIKDIIKNSKNRDLTVAIIVRADQYKQKKDEGDKIVARAIGELADFASPYNVKIAFYPHVWLYYEKIDHIVKLVNMIDRDNVGAIFNVCHFLKAEGEQHLKDKLLKVLPHLFLVSINGADSGNTKEMGWDQLIQPLGDGTFNTYQVVKILWDHGYEGPIGIQCYNVDQDCRLALYKSMSTWRKFKLKYMVSE